MYQQAGLIEVPTVAGLLDTARVLACQPLMTGPAVAVVTNSRSPGVLAAAAVETAGLQIVDPPFPLDWKSQDADYERAVQAAVEADDVDAVLVIHTPRSLRRSADRSITSIGPRPVRPSRSSP